MVRAILDGRKTQTRRVVRMQPPGRFHLDGYEGFAGGIYARFESPDGDPEPGKHTVRCPYGKPGDRLWVRETFQIGYETGEPGRYSIIPWTGDPVTGKGDTMTNDKLREAIAESIADNTAERYADCEAIADDILALFRERGHGREVARCWTCPFSVDATGYGNLVCGWEDNGLPDVPPDAHGNTLEKNRPPPPAWCQLRSGPVMLWLREGV